MERTLLILDIDETLVFSADEPLERAPDCMIGSYHVYLRPFLRESLNQIALWYDVAVWSSGSGIYVRSVVDAIFPPDYGLQFVWSNERCTRRFDGERSEFFYAKDLSKVKSLGRSLDRVLMIDDSPEKLWRHYGNHIRVAPFMGDSTDDELRVLLPFLELLRDLPSVRSVEKRGWRNR